MARTPPPPPPEGPSPGGPWYRRYWGYSNRPYGGCGCMYALVIFLLIYFLFAWAFSWPWFWVI